MKKIINGKKYDTETAKLMAQDYSDVPRNDFRFWWEGLYKKKTGELFLHGEGGPLSKYGESCENITKGGEKILPLTTEKAKKWAEAHCSVAEYENLFGEVEE